MASIPSRGRRTHSCSLCVSSTFPFSAATFISFFCIVSLGFSVFSTAIAVPRKLIVPTPEEKLTAAIYAANNGSTLVFNLDQDVVLTRPLPWLQKSFSMRGRCGSAASRRRCFIDGAGRFPILVSYAAPCAVSLSNIEFRNALGVAAYIKSCDLKINGCLFISNSAVRGAAISMGLGQQKLEVTSSSFVNNKATGGSGGAIATSSRGGGKINGCTFSGNEATGKGGAIVHSSGTKPLVIVGSNFTGNSARSGGGAVWVEPNGGTAGDVFFMSTSFGMNRAIGSMGGAIGLEDPLNGHFCGCSFAGNTASLGGADVAVIDDGNGRPMYVNFCPSRPSGVIVRPNPLAVAVVDTCFFCAVPGG